MAELNALIERDPYAAFDVPTAAKRVVTFLPAPPPSRPRLPLELDGARVLTVQGREAFTAYIPTPRGPVFMRLIEQAFGQGQTTRTWATVQKCARA